MVPDNDKPTSSAVSSDMPSKMVGVRQRTNITASGMRISHAWRLRFAAGTTSSKIIKAPRSR